jgi:hypothetical protein
MRATLLALLPVAAIAGSSVPLVAQPRPHAPPRHCPELRTEGFCPYDSGWRPAADNPLFSPLHPGDPTAAGGPACVVSDSRGRSLIDYNTEEPAVAMRIAGGLVRFRPAPGHPNLDLFIAPEGRLGIRQGAVVAQDHESDAHRATLTFTDRHGRRQTASARIDCGV